MAKVLELISYEGNNQELVAKVSIDDLRNRSNLIVDESQEALFYKDGQALDLFTSGRHELTTDDSLPFFKRVFKNLFGTNSPLPCSVYFINKVHVLDMVWGTPSAIPLVDPKYNVKIEVCANGSMGVRIVDSRRFIVKVMGQIHSVSADDLRRYIKGVMIANIKECIASVIVKEGVSVMEISTQLLSLSDKMTKDINARIIDGYGIELVNFYFNAIEPTQASLEEINKLLNAHNRITIDAQKTIIQGQAEQQVELMKGDVAAQNMVKQGQAVKNVYDTMGSELWQKNKEIETINNIAKNPVAGGVPPMAGPPLFGPPPMGGQFMYGGYQSMMTANTLANDFVKPMSNQQQNQPPRQNKFDEAPASTMSEQYNNAKPVAQPVEVNQNKQKLKELKEWFDDGLIDEKEYAQKKSEILSRL